jgi:multidrug efflux system membrane fusion protein
MVARSRCVRVEVKYLVALGLLAAVIGCNKNEAQPAAQAMARPPAPVTVAVAAEQDVPVYIDEIGRTVASQVVNIVPQVGGQIMERAFEDGATIKQGQRLFTIDPRPYQAKVREAEANVGQANAQLELARADYNRLKKAFSIQAASQEDLDTKQAALDTATAQVKVTAAALDTAKLNLSFCTIDSPVAGRAGQRLVDVGNVVKANETNLVTIQQLEPLYVDFTITERDFPTVKELSGKGTLQTQVSLPQNPGETRGGPLTFIDTAVQPGAGRLRVQATLPNQDHYFWPGQFVNVRLVLRTIEKAVLIPYACTQMGQQGPYVYVVKADSTAEQRPIVMGQRQGPQVVIEKGIKAGERVVLTGQLSVSPGGAVHVVEPAGAPPGTGGPDSPAAPGADVSNTTKPEAAQNGGAQ